MRHSACTHVPFLGKDNLTTIVEWEEEMNLNEWTRPELTQP